MTAHPETVKNFLRAFKKAASDSEIIFAQRRKNWDALVDLGLTAEAGESHRRPETHLHLIPRKRTPAQFPAEEEIMKNLN